MPPKLTLATTLTSILLLLCIFSSAQSVDSILHKIDPKRYADVISQKASRLEEKLTEKSLDALSKLEKQETKLYNKLLKTKDSLSAKAQLGIIKEKYAALTTKLKSPQLPGGVQQYIPKLDSLTTSLKFLDGLGKSANISEAIKKASALQGKFNQAEEIKRFIKERKELLKAQFEKLGMVKQLKQFNKKAYYYAAQVKEYKEILNDPKKIEKKALELLAKTKLFKDFMAKNSLFASLFPRTDDPSDPAYSASLAGLQTRVQVNTLIQQQISSGGPNAAQQLQQNLGAAQSQLNALKNKMAQFGSRGSENIMPDGFKPNEQKTKSFFRRLELGTNVQSQKANGFFPVTSDLGLSVGYKINEKSIVGVGGSYKLGLGSGFRNMRLSHQGVGLRSFIDWKVKGSLWITGGFEMNYQSVFNSIYELRSLDAWQQSGLLGLSKSIPIKSKFFKKTKIQLLWDFISYEQVPRTQPIKFRVGYNF